MQLDLHPKKVRLVIVLSTLAACAYFLAKGTTSYLAGKYLPPNISTAKAAGPAAGAEAAKGERPPDMKVILARNIFDPTTGALWPPKENTNATSATAAPEATPPPALAPGQMPPACEGQVKMVSSIFSPKWPEWSFASLSLGSASPLLYRMGNTVDGKEVDSVYPEAVFLKTSNGALCSLTMFKPPASAVAPKPAALAPAAAPEEPGGGFYGSSLSEAELDQNIRQISDTKYNVQRGLIDKVLANQAELMRSARVVPHEENGRVVGVKLYGIRRSSLLGKLGLQNGDLLRTVNGFDMSSPDTALEAYAKLRSASALSLAVTRRGTAVTMDYQVTN